MNEHAVKQLAVLFSFLS